MTKRKPKADYFIALLAGGDIKMMRDVKTLAALQGIYVKIHWAPGKGVIPMDKRPIPADVDIVIALRDPLLSRHVRDRIMFEAKKSAWGISPLPTVKAVLTDLSEAGFIDAAIDIDIVEGRKSPEPDVIAPEYMPKEGPVVVANDPSAALRAGGLVMRKKRIEMGMGPTELGKQVGVSGGYIGHIEAGRMRPSSQVCDNVERLLQLPTGTLPRVAVRNNHRLKPAELMPAPVPAKQEPVLLLQDVELEHKPLVASPSPQMVLARAKMAELKPDEAKELLADLLEDYNGFISRLLGIKTMMGKHKVAKIILTQHSISVLEEG